MTSSMYKSTIIYHKVNIDSFSVPSTNYMSDYPSAINSRPNSLNLNFAYGVATSHQKLLDAISAKSTIPDHLIFNIASVHDCREALLGEIQAVRDLMKLHSSFCQGNRNRPVYTNPVVFVEYFGEYNTKGLDYSHRKYILEFYKKFMQHSSDFGIYIQEYEKILVLSYNPLSPMKDFQLSFLLYIFRNIDIVREILKDFKDSEKVSFGEFLSYLSVKFLRQFSWGNASNPAMALSLFAYLLTNKDIVLNYVNYDNLNGPVQLCSTIPSIIIINYVRDVVLPTITSKQILMEYTYPCSSSIQKPIEEIYELLVEIKSLKEELAISKKGNENGNA